MNSRPSLRRGDVAQPEDHDEQPADQRRPVHQPGEHRLEDLDHRPDQPVLVLRLDPALEEDRDQRRHERDREDRHADQGEGLGEGQRVEQLPLAAR